MDKFIKIQSNQGAGFNSVKRLCDFDIPAGSVYDLSESYVNLVCKVDTNDDGANGGQGVYEIKSTFDGKENVFPTVSFIKNAHLSSAKTGQICNVRKVDTLQSTLHQFTKSFQHIAGEEYHNPTNTMSKQFTRNSIFRELHKEGTDESISKEARIIVPLKDMFDYCNYGEYDSGRHGATRLGLELQVDKYAPLTSTDDNHASFRDRNTFGSFTTPAALNANKTTITSDYVFRSLEESPYFVGMKIDITGVDAASPPVAANYTATRKITGIQYVKDGGANNRKVILTLNAAIFDAAPAVVSTTYNISVGITDITGGTGISSNFSAAELVLKVVGKPLGLDAKPRTYQTYLSEEYQGGTNTSHQHQVNIEPNCSGVYIMYPNSVISENDGLNAGANYRLRHNDMDLTNRNVNFFTPVHKERNLMTLSNSGYPVKNLIAFAPASKEDQSQEASYQGLTDTIDVKMVASPLKPMPVYSLLQINHEDLGSGLGRVIVYKEIQSVV